MTANWTIDGVKAALAAKKISARELAADFYKRIEARHPWCFPSLARTWPPKDTIRLRKVNEKSLGKAADINSTTYNVPESAESVTNENRRC